MELHHQAATSCLGPASGTVAVILRDVLSLFQAQLNAGMVDTASLQPSNIIQKQIAATRAIFQDGLGQSGVRTALHYTIPNVEVLIGTASGALERILSVLQEQLNLPFKGAYAGHLGNFETFELHPWLDAPQPFLERNPIKLYHVRRQRFQDVGKGLRALGKRADSVRSDTALIEAVPNPNLDRSGPQIMEICRAEAFAAEAHTAHIVGRVNGEVILDRLVKLPAGERRIPFQTQEQLDQFDFRLFSDDGKALLHSEHQSFVNRIGFVLAPVGRQMTIEDNLSNRAKSKDKGLGSQASSVVVHSSHRSMIGAPREGNWRKFAEDMEQRVAACLPNSSEDKWFPRGIEGEVGAIMHLNHLINAGQITRAVLVDPWFGAEAVQRFVLRLGSQGVALTILTSWTDTDPDTGMDLQGNRVKKFVTTR